MEEIGQHGADSLGRVNGSSVLCNSLPVLLNRLIKKVAA
jgi:hypothetical protein